MCETCALWETSFGHPSVISVPPSQLFLFLEPVFDGLVALWTLSAKDD